jgi:ADP-heptose:LPS heptosyltransferase
LGFMSNARLNDSSIEKVAIMRSLPGLGDMLCCVPALRALRCAIPKAKITLIGLPSAKSFVQRFNNYVDEWLEFPGYPGIPEVAFRLQTLSLFLKTTQQLAFDWALQMHGSGIQSNGFTTALGSKQSGGFFQPGYFCPNDGTFLPYPDYEPEVWRHLRLMEFLGIPLQGDHLEFPIWESDRRELQALMSTYSLTPHHYICVHPGASSLEKCWQPHNFATVADRIAAQGFQVVLTGHTPLERQLVDVIVQEMHYPVTNLFGKTSLGGLAALLQQSRLVICNDTGVSHLTVALEVNSVVIFSNSDSQRWAPLNRRSHRIVHAASSTAVCDVLTEVHSLLHSELMYAS